ncbi:hypothetical protein Acr_18g0004040 [Actinidia rufa]|uniref:Tyrosinase copper-binding domain-containing protein n=1 Tax=Actinidia rufa TaxID=165716 RepID=A0A7J0G612_9ERIC|nr:hypothetical protein Acr_18g0004040 [Actinidia rufa]
MPPLKIAKPPKGSSIGEMCSLGLGGLYGAAGLAADPLAFAAPITPPDISKCGPADLPAGAKPTNCCPPRSTKIIDFKLPSPTNTMRDTSVISWEHLPCLGTSQIPGLDRWRTFLTGQFTYGVGTGTQPNLENMGNFYSAARDPIFYAHHSNVDRMWSVWKTLGGRRKDFTDPDWLNAGFLFYNENAELVRVNVKDCLDTKKLGYEYQYVDIPWLTTKPTPRIGKVFRKVKNAVKAIAAETPMNADDVFPRKLDGVVKVIVPRPMKRRSKKQKEEEEEVLVIDGIEVPRDVFAKFDVFINDEDEAASGPDKTEFAGSFVNIPHKHKHHKKIKTRLRLGISELLEDLDAEDDEGVLVTLVPKCGSEDVVIGSVKIEFDS